jgi:cell division protein FtsL
VQTDEETGMKSINYVGMIGHLVEAIKEQQTQIDELKAEVAELKG